MGLPKGDHHYSWCHTAVAGACTGTVHTSMHFVACGQSVAPPNEWTDGQLIKPVIALINSTIYVETLRLISVDITGGSEGGQEQVNLVGESSGPRLDSSQFQTRKPL